MFGVNNKLPIWVTLTYNHFAVLLNGNERLKKIMNKSNHILKLMPAFHHLVV